MRKIFLFLLSFTASFFFFSVHVLAVCPVCTIAVGAGLGISRALGIDDAVTSVWIGGLILSMSFWMIDWIGKKKKSPLSSKYQWLTIIGMYVITLLPLYYGKYIGRVYNTFWGIDKILLGTAFGTLAFMIGKWADGKAREKYGKQFFIYQKVIFPVVSLIITSIALHFIVS